MTSTKKKMPAKAPGKKTAGKRVPQHNEPKAKMPPHAGIPKEMRRPIPTEGANFKTAGHNVSGGGKRMAGSKKKTRK